MARSKFRSQATANSNAIELFGRKKEPEQNLWIAVKSERPRNKRLHQGYKRLTNNRSSKEMAHD
jgi:hypothetical protein